MNEKYKGILDNKRIDWQKHQRIIKIVDKDADNILFLHGFTSHYKGKLRLIDDLKKYNFYSFLMPGHFVSKEPFEDHEIFIAYFYELAVKFILDHDLKNLILFGHSMGGGLSLLLSSDQRVKDRIKKVVLEAPFNPAAQTTWDFTKTLIPKTIEETKAMIDGLLYDPLKVFGSQENYQDAILEEFKTSQELIVLDKMLNLENTELFMQCINNNLHLMQKPTLFILGKYDKIVPAKKTKEIFNTTNFEVKIIDKCGHSPFNEAYPIALDYLKQFLDK
ncbi:alpha/beta fold hydrolase [Mycoplasmopsis edwardii]|uniref:Alpha/beta hydrolase n=1 Tax=Mycoplasmopsis edwardii TaxID=53558 RepID=A0ACD4PH28_9BACT|nr:alpha/beta hydrolase [Mycoplasmopsis edwardii]WBP83892.1 alpha/beta hydrolase [Mycoplasmopsis edwardii]